MHLKNMHLNVRERENTNIRIQELLDRQLIKIS